MTQRMLLLCLLLSPHLSWGRSWTDVEVLHDTIHHVDDLGRAYLNAMDPLYSNTLAPTRQPTPLPTRAPTNRPSKSRPPTREPTRKPSRKPTPTPSLPPTNASTAELWSWNAPPDRPNPWYFNYDTRKNARFGPGYPAMSMLADSANKIQMTYKNNAWVNVFADPHSYWNEFTSRGHGPWQGVLDNRDPLRNQCGRTGMQSPIDVRSSGATCDEHHEVRSRPGDLRINAKNVTKQILPSKLRLLYDRRPCANLNRVECQEPDPPHADFPNGWGGMADVLHVDFKVPSEHLVEGKRYDAEMQIYHIHPGRRRLPTQVAMMEVREFGYNFYFEEALKAFELQFKQDWSECRAKQRRERQLVTDMHKLLGENVSSPHVDYNTWADFSTPTDHPSFEEELQQRNLQIGVWDPHHEMLVPSIHFYRYDGSLTEPPCGEWVSWFICDKPMVIGPDQLFRLKHLLFEHVDPQTCRKTSVHFEQSVARPIQETGSRPIWQCTRFDYGPDK